MSLPREDVVLFGSKACHKTQHYQKLLSELGVPFSFLDVVENQEHANELKSLYVTHKLNFPTLLVKDKKLRNPFDSELVKWLEKKELL